jgi:hypothetical protein
MASAQYTLQRAQYVDAPALRRVPNSPEHLASIKGAAPILGRALALMTRLSFDGPRPDRNDLEPGPPQRETSVGVVWDLVLYGEIERLQARYNIGVYNAADARYDTVPSSEFRQRTLVQNGRTFLASLAVRF